MRTFADFGNVPANVCNGKLQKIKKIFNVKAYICGVIKNKILIEKQLTTYYKQSKILQS